jgi:hypothetical protein
MFLSVCKLRHENNLLDIDLKSKTRKLYLRLRIKKYAKLSQLRNQIYPECFWIFFGSFLIL